MKIKVLPILILIMVASISVEASNINQQLSDAADELNVDKVKTLLDSGADPNWLDTSDTLSSSILEQVARRQLFSGQKTQDKQIEVVTLLFENGVKLGPHDKNILYVPILRGAYDLTKLLIKHGASPTKFSQYTSITPVELAAENGHLDIKDLLVKNGAEDLDIKTIVQLVFVNSASCSSIPDLKYLVKEGAKVNVKNRQGETALINSLSSSLPVILSGHDHAFFYLLDLGADVNLHGNKGNCHDWDTTPLHEAIRTPPHTSDKNSKSGVKDISKKVLDSLIKAGAHVSSRDEFGRTPLHTAAMHNNIYAAQLLLKHNAKVMPRDGKGKTPLDYAESEDMIKLLKDNGAKEF